MVYIQSNSQRTLPHHADCAMALYGAIDCGLDYRLTSFEEVESGKFDTLIRKHPFIGSVEFMRLVFSRIGITDVKLPQNSNRSHQILTLGEVKSRVSCGEKLFIKPLEIKLFTGFVLDNSIYNSITGIPDDTQVLVYEPFASQIVAEWRTYIFENKIEDIKNYSGDLFVVPNKKFIEELIQKNRSTFPNAYVIDIGILQGGDNVVIEYNDAWAIGNYGMPNDTYFRFLKNRYFDIIRPK
jgi:hypothetical protein